MIEIPVFLLSREATVCRKNPPLVRITIRISGSGFLYNMVRIIAGTLVKIGMGVYPPEKMEEILEEEMEEREPVI